MAEMVQVRLQSGDTFQTCWVPTEKPFKVGNTITLKKSDDPQREWTVLSMSEPKDAKLIHTDWDAGGVKSAH